MCQEQKIEEVLQVLMKKPSSFYRDWSDEKKDGYLAYRDRVIRAIKKLNNKNV